MAADDEVTVEDLRTEGALVIGDPGAITDSANIRPGAVEPVVVWPKSPAPRGLAIESLTLDGNWDGLFNSTNEIFFTSLAFDLSGEKPTILPPEGVDAKTVIYKAQRGDTIRFTLGDGAPLFPKRVVTGAIVVYVMVFESDASSQHLGETLAKVHEDLTSDGSVMDKIKDLIKNPGKTLADEALSIATAALQPLATVLKQNQNDFVAPFQGYWSAEGDWSSQLAGSHNGVSIKLNEL